MVWLKQLEAELVSEEPSAFFKCCGSSAQTLTYCFIRRHQTDQDDCRHDRSYIDCKVGNRSPGDVGISLIFVWGRLIHYICSGDMNALTSQPSSQTVFEYLAGCWKRTYAVKLALTKRVSLFIGSCSIIGPCTESALELCTSGCTTCK